MHEPEHTVRSVASPFVQPGPEDARAQRRVGTTLPAMHPPPYLPSRRAVAHVEVEPVAAPEPVDEVEPVNAAETFATEVPATEPLATEVPATERPAPEPAIAPATAAELPENAAPERRETPTTVEWVDAMPATQDDVDDAGDAAEEAEAAPSVGSTPMGGAEREAAGLLRELAERIESGRLRLPSLPSVRSDAGLLTVVLAALLNAEGAGEAMADSTTSDDAA